MSDNKPIEIEGDLSTTQGRRNLAAHNLLGKLVEDKLILVTRENIPRAINIVSIAIELFMERETR